MHRHATRHARTLACLLAIGMLGACHKQADGNDHAVYDGTTLTVDGTAYPRQKADPATVAGHVIVTAAPDARAAALALARRFGLEPVGQAATGELVLAVPEGFEAQWADALGERLGPRASAEVESRLFPMHTGPVDAQLLAAAASGAAEAEAASGAPDAGGRGMFRPASAAAAAPTAGAPVPEGEPPADVVRRLTFEMYDELERNGGMPLTVTATGRSFVAHVKLFSAVKDECHRVPQSPPGEFECSARLKQSLCANDCDPAAEPPGDSATRIYIKWDAARGEWVRG